MEFTHYHFEKCTICQDAYTTTYTEIRPGMNIYVCEDCVDAAKYNFIWLCLHCGKVYLRPKKVVINNTTDEELKNAYMLCGEIQVIQAIEMCHNCDPKGIKRYMNLQVTSMEC